MAADSTNMKKDLDITSYKDFQRLIKGHTSKSMQKMYDQLYFTKHVGNKEVSATYFKTLGLAQTNYTEIPLALAEIQQEDRVIDIGCGRGEIVFQAAQAGATAVGIDYAECAIGIARETRKHHSKEIQLRTTFMCCDAEKLGFENNYFQLRSLFLVGGIVK